jgi:hypothetical protein
VLCADGADAGDGLASEKCDFEMNEPTTTSPTISDEIALAFCHF